MRQLLLDLLTCRRVNGAMRAKHASYVWLQENGEVAGEWVGVAIRGGRRGPGMGGNRRSASHIDYHIA